MIWRDSLSHVCKLLLEKHDVFCATSVQEQSEPQSEFFLDAAISNVHPRRKFELNASDSLLQQCCNHFKVSWHPSFKDSFRKNKNRIPTWPRGLVGSYTHSHSKSVFSACFMATALCTRYISLGADIEFFSQFEDCLSDDLFLNSFSTPLERNVLKESGFKNVETILFSAKESVYKCLSPAIFHEKNSYPGVYFNFLDITCVNADIVNQQILFSLFDKKHETNTLPNLLPSLSCQIFSFAQGVVTLCAVKKESQHVFDSFQEKSYFFEPM
jgi:4'-phosphopantetheinyl transferase EntD